MYSLDFIQSRISFFETEIPRYEEAVFTLNTTPGMKSYNISTGQTSQSVTLDEGTKKLQWMYEQLAYWRSLLNGGGVSYLRPIQAGKL